ncbi:MAG TPA: sulfatase-like hydrolase/transferase [Candidatus Brocadiia bacterium]|nr:sulfatase-like hydrolase/transferase [Candidatus Brocadiia bacterium]
MKRRDFLKSLAGGAAALSLAPRAGAAEETRMSRRPNILFLFTDDQRFDTIRALGNEEIRTPTLDGLVRDGTTFMRAHIMGSTCPAVCICSRASLLTGRGLYRVPHQIPGDMPTWPRTLRDAGYETFGTGKWHNGAPSYARGFASGADIFFGGMENHAKVPVFDFQPDGKYPKERQRIGTKFSSELFSDAAIDFLKRYEGDKPFFMYVAYTAPHDPRMPPKPFADMYDPEKIALPRNFMPEHPFDNGEMKIRDEMLAPFPRTAEVVRRHIAAYYGMITHVDDQIGRVLQALGDAGHAGNTIVIFAGDNGLAVGRHGLMGKQNMYEHSMRVPLIISGPGVPKNARSDALCYLHDVFPTCCETAGIPIPPTVESRSLLPLVKGEAKTGIDSVFGAYMSVQRMIREERYKLIEYTVKDMRMTQLFDLAEDPWEIVNLAERTEYRENLERLREKLAGWKKTVGDPTAG